MPLPQGRKPLDNSWYKDWLTPYPDITRVEVIDSTGRAYAKWDVKDVQLSIQDDGRTMKIFLKDEK